MPFLTQFPNEFFRKELRFDFIYWPIDQTGVANNTFIHLTTLYYRSVFHCQHEEKKKHVNRKCQIFGRITHKMNTCLFIGPITIGQLNTFSMNFDQLVLTGSVLTTNNQWMTPILTPPTTKKNTIADYLS